MAYLHKQDIVIIQTGWQDHPGSRRRHAIPAL